MSNNEQNANQPLNEQDLKVYVRRLQHDLRTPLTHILGFSELLVEEPPPPGVGNVASRLSQIASAGKAILDHMNETFPLTEPAARRAALLDLREVIHAQTSVTTTLSATLHDEIVMLALPDQADFISALEQIHSASTRLTNATDSTISSLLDAIQPAAPVVPRGRGTRPLTKPVDPTEPKLAGAILIVDDEESNREMLAHLLTRQGHSVTLAPSGAVALELLRGQKFDVVLLDLMMPGLNGIQVLETIKASEPIRHIPVIMISGMDDLQDVVKCIETGALDFLHKPFDPTLLRARISAALEKKRARDQEILYLTQVEQLMFAAGAVENGSFQQDSLRELAARQDKLGQLARVFQHMATEVQQREQRLLEEVQELRIQIDHGWMQTRVNEITETEYFHRLELMANELREESPV